MVATAEKTEQRNVFLNYSVFQAFILTSGVFDRTLMKISLIFHVVTRPLSILSEWLKRGRGMLTAEKRGSTFAVFP